jgi:hypothetical protein
MATLVTFAVLVTASGCGSARREPDKQHATKENEKAARRQAAEQRIAELAKKHGANTNWTDSIRANPDDVVGAFTFQRQEVFDPLLGHPIVALVEIMDICRAGDGYRLICRFSLDHPQFDAWGQTYFMLDLAREKARQLADSPDARFLEVFAVVALPRRADWRFNREVTAEKSEAAHEGAIASVGEVSVELWITGTCLDVERIPDYR